MHVSVVEDTYEIAFAYDPALIEFCKSLQRGSYNPRRQLWTATRNVPNAIDLHQAGHFYDESLLRFEPVIETHEGYPWKLDMTPYKHQAEFQKWFSTRKKALLAAEMGVGKTGMSMMAMQQHRVAPSDVVIVCPSSLIYNWRDEFLKFAGEHSVPVVGTTSARLKMLEIPGLHIVNYEFLTLNEKAQKLLAKKKVVVLDESHKIKNPSAQRSKVIHKYCEGKDMVLLLTGTPVSQGAQDYYSQFRAIDKTLLGASFTAFKARYCIQEQVRGAPLGVRKITGYKNLDELNRVIAPYCYTLLKKDCLDLPEKTYLKHYVDLSQEQAVTYKQLKMEMAAFVGMDTDNPVLAANVLTRMLRLSQVTQGFVTLPEQDNSDKKTLHLFKGNPKLAALEEIIEGLPERESVVIMCRFSQDIANVKGMLIKNKISGCIIDGSVKPEDRQAHIDAFQRGDVRVLVGQIQVAGVGLNLTKASTLIFYSNDYSLVNRLQAEDRIHRIGQTSKCVYIDIVARGTVDELVIRALNGKTDVASQLTELRKHFSS